MTMFKSVSAAQFAGVVVGAFYVAPGAIFLQFPFICTPLALARLQQHISSRFIHPIIARAPELWLAPGAELEVNAKTVVSYSFPPPFPRHCLAWDVWAFGLILYSVFTATTRTLYSYTGPSTLENALQGFLLQFGKPSIAVARKHGWRCVEESMGSFRERGWSVLIQKDQGQQKNM